MKEIILDICQPANDCEDHDDGDDFASATSFVLRGQETGSSDDTVFSHGMVGKKVLKFTSGIDR